MKRKIFKFSAFLIVIVTLGFLLFSGVVMLLWNYTLTPLFNISAITLWQAAGILLLAKILFGGHRRWRRCRECNEQRYYTRCTTVHSV